MIFFHGKNGPKEPNFEKEIFLNCQILYNKVPVGS
jgi:hypothetical protein